MRVLTVRDPWAWLIINAGKDVENRGWRTNCRGLLAIHAAAGMTHSEYWAAVSFALAIKQAMVVRIPSFTDLIRGAIIGTVEVVDCVTASPSPWFTGPYGLVLRNPVALAKPIPAKGKLGFWDWEGEANA